MYSQAIQIYRRLQRKIAGLTDTVALGMLVDQSTGKWLLVKKPSTSDTDPGLWGFPGGHCNSGEDIREALDRELQEEIGTKVDRCVEEKSLRKLTPEGTTLSFWRCEVSQPTITLNPNELEEFKWVTPDEAQELQCIGDTKLIIENLSRRMAENKTAMVTREEFRTTMLGKFASIGISPAELGRMCRNRLIKTSNIDTRLLTSLSMPSLAVLAASALYASHVAGRAGGRLAADLVHESPKEFASRVKATEIMSAYEQALNEIKKKKQLPQKTDVALTA